MLGIKGQVLHHVHFKFEGSWLVVRLNVLLTRKLLSVPMLLLYLKKISGAGRKWCCNGEQNGT